MVRTTEPARLSSISQSSAKTANSYIEREAADSLNFTAWHQKRFQRLKRSWRSRVQDFGLAMLQAQTGTKQHAVVSASLPVPLQVSGFSTSPMRSPITSTIFLASSGSVLVFRIGRGQSASVFAQAAASIWINQL